MQLSELYRRGIVSPLNSAADIAFRSGETCESTQVNFVPIDNALFTVLWQLDFFLELNRKCDSLIDDYEEESLDGEQLDMALAVAQSFRSRATSPRTLEFLDEFAKLVEHARTLRLSVEFIL